MKKIYLLLILFLFFMKVNAQWKQNGFSNVSSIAANSTAIFAGTGSGIFISEDNGQNWYPKNDGLINLNISHIQT